ncbi:hypothetical protein GHT07_16130 [Caenimonas koreensis DSM 17982]|uniref:Uncharacterized protein n=1 Tax=Caenimonas koreensis DSM 17982 TaxID=1121255 RepID=A0A844BB79_9BURK|nr:hypothetical protein [Caenimonas koreensis DSM 17982]
MGAATTAGAGAGVGAGAGGAEGGGGGGGGGGAGALSAGTCASCSLRRSFRGLSGGFAAAVSMAVVLVTRDGGCSQVWAQW